MNNFKHYSSIENSYRNKTVNYFEQFTTPETIWCATEKVHGCNFSASCDGSTIRWGKRSSFIPDEELVSFNRADLVQVKYQEAVLKLFHLLSQQLGDNDKPLQFIRVFGELCGGKYAGYPNLGKAVQKEINYCPGIEFIVFDIFAGFEDLESPDEGGEGDEDEVLVPHAGHNHWLDMEFVASSCQEVGIPSSPILSTGSMHDLLKLNPRFESRIHELFELPKLDNNYSEGYVIKPLHEVHTPRGRIILKFKNPEFAEKSVPPAIKKLHNPKPVFIMSEVDQIIMEECCLYINENRYNSVISKLSEDEKLNSKKVLGLLVKDAFIDILKDFEEGKINSKNRSIITKEVFAYATKIFKK